MPLFCSPLLALLRAQGAVDGFLSPSPNPSSFHVLAVLMGSKTRGCVSSHRQLHRPARCVPLAQSPSCSGPCRAAKEKLAAITPALLLCGAGQNFIVHLKKQQQQQKKNNPKPATGCRACGASTPKPPRSRSLGTGWHAGPQPELMAFPPQLLGIFLFGDGFQIQIGCCSLSCSWFAVSLLGFCPAVLPAKYSQGFAVPSRRFPC